ncbi:MAG: hypothetical protein ACSW8I_08615 [bacterium]
MGERWENNGRTMGEMSQRTAVTHLMERWRDRQPMHYENTFCQFGERLYICS